MKNVTMQDIADYLHISKNSVSQALRDKNGVSEETKKKVAEAADKLGYFYNKSFSSINSQRHFLLIATEFALSQTSFFGKILTGLKNGLELNGDSLVIETIHAEAIQNCELPVSLLNEKFDGIFILSHIENTYIKKVIDYGIPCVLIDHHHPSFAADAVLSQNIDGSFVAVEYLIKLGCKSVGFVGDINFSPSYDERLYGFKKAMNTYQIPIHEEQIISNIKEDQTLLFDRLNQISQMPDAWFCVNSGLAFILNSFLRSNGFSIPQDIALLCFDDTEFTRMAQPQISCIATDLEYMEVCARNLMEQRLLAIDAPFVQMNIVPKLILRAST